MVWSCLFSNGSSIMSRLNPHEKKHIMYESFDHLNAFISIIDQNPIYKLQEAIIPSDIHQAIYLVI